MSANRDQLKTSRDGRPLLSRRRFLAWGGAGAVAVTAGGWAAAPLAQASASPSPAPGPASHHGPYDLATWESLADAAITLRAGAAAHAVTAGRPVPGAGQSFSVVLTFTGGPHSGFPSKDGTFQLHHSTTGQFPLFMVNVSPGSFVATFNN